MEEGSKLKKRLWLREKARAVSSSKLREQFIDGKEVFLNLRDVLKKDLSYMVLATSLVPNTIHPTVEPCESFAYKFLGHPLITTTRRDTYVVDGTFLGNFEIFKYVFPDESNLFLCPSCSLVAKSEKNLGLSFTEFLVDLGEASFLGVRDSKVIPIYRRDL